MTASKSLTLTASTIDFLNELIADRLLQHRRELRKTEELSTAGARHWISFVNGEIEKATAAQRELQAVGSAEKAPPAERRDDSAYPSVEVSAVRLAQTREGLLLVAIQVPFEGWKNVIQAENRSQEFSGVWGAGVSGGVVV